MVGDIDIKEGMIEVNHTLDYYNHADSGRYFSIHTPKKDMGKRLISMLNEVREAFLVEKRYQEMNGLVCKAVVDGYTDLYLLTVLEMYSTRGL